MGIATEQGSIMSPPQFSPPPGFTKNISAFCSEFLLLCYFRHIFSTFDHLLKDVKVVHVILVRERQQTTIKTSRNVNKNDISSRAIKNSNLLTGKHFKIHITILVFHEQMLGVNGRIYSIFYKISHKCL
jgi:hypothetical protein